MSTTAGRAWRPLQDTADEAQILYNVANAWQNWRRGVDFYDEGELIWLDADTTIRELSNGARSLDDFIHAFYGINDGSYAVVTYTFDDVVAALNKVQPHDWAAFLRARLDTTDLFKADEKVRKHTNLMDSLGIMIDTGDTPGALVDVLWQSVAFESGLAPGMKLIAVNGDKFTTDILKDAVAAAKTTTAPIELLMQSGDSFSTVKVNYHGGLRYPHLERLDAATDRIGDIAKARN